ncbi:MAG: helix-turn-helix transcriptional regulator [Clostridiales bacterium]|nr:helix-turn-helix transcriptional regulator [Clostridiales bacterium]
MYKVDFSGTLPTVNYSGRVKQCANQWTHDGIVQDCDVIGILLSGECKFTLDHGKYEIVQHAGEAIVIPHGVYYTGSCEVKCEYYYFHIKDRIIPVTEDEIKQALAVAEPILNQNIKPNSYTRVPTIYDCMFLGQLTDITRVMKRIISLLTDCDLEITKRDVNSRLRLDLNFCQILTLICGEYMTSLSANTNYPATLERILAFIYANYTEKITLQSLSEQFGLSKQYIIRLFRKHLETSVTQFILDLKLSHVPELLTKSSMNISEIAAYLGFSNIYYFSRMFKKKYSVSPTKFTNI